MKILYHHRTQGRRVERVHILGLVQALRERGHEVRILSPPGVRLEEPAPQGEAAGRSPSGAGPVLAPGSSVEESGTSDAAPGQRHVSGVASRIWALVSKAAPQIAFELLEQAYNLVAWRRLERCLREGSWDCLYERYALNTWIGHRLARRYGVPHVLEVNDATGIQRERPIAWVAPARRCEQAVWGDAAAIFTISSAFAAIIRERGIPAERIHVIPNAVNPAAFTTTAEDVREVRERYGLADSVVVGFAGSFARWHGLDLFCRALPALLEDDEQVKVLLVGDGKLREAVEAEIMERGLRERVIFTGWVPHERIPPLLEAMDIGVIPDSNEYGSPMKLFEYLFCGAVPVVPDYPPMRDVIEHGVHGLIFPRRDMAAMVAAIRRLLEQPALRREMAARGRALVRSRHTWAANAERVETVIRSLRRSGRR
jgi:glycosyltransferase involved in cell wall biosynthesis